MSPDGSQCKLILAGAQYWQKCTAIEAEMARALYLSRAIRELAARGRATPHHSAGEVVLSWAEGLHQIQQTLSISVEVAGRFVIRA